MKKLSLLLLFCCLLIACSSQKTKVDVMIQHGSIIDIVNGEVSSNKILLLNADSIYGIIDEVQKSNYTAQNEIDALGKFILPGLWDNHVHFGGGDSLIQENKDLLPLYIANGITGVRDAAADIAPSVLQWRDEINRGELFGPRLFTSGPKLEGYNSVWLGDLEIGTRAEMLAAFDSLQKLKVDFVKITDNTISSEIYLECLKEAKMRKMKISGHIPFALTLEQVSDAGLASVEHLGYALRAGSPQREEVMKKVAEGKMSPADATQIFIESFDASLASAAYAKIAANGTAITPTLKISKTLAYLDKDDHSRDEYLSYVGPGLVKTYEGRVIRAAQADEAEIAQRHARYEKVKTLLPLLHQAGVMIIAGTDSGYLNSFVYPGLALHEELILFVEAGLTPLQALQASILSGPKYLGVQDQFGTLETGKSGDVLILNGNPLEDISSTQDISTVILRGKIYNRQSLDSILLTVKEKATP
ncbi:MAG: amidohydrolase family protein [Cyclobacteriaceae bacterium]